VQVVAAVGDVMKTVARTLVKKVKDPRIVANFKETILFYWNKFWNAKDI